MRKMWPRWIQKLDQVYATRKVSVLDYLFASLHSSHWPWKITFLSLWYSLWSRLCLVLVGASVVLMHIWLTYYHPTSFLHSIYYLSHIRSGRHWPPASQRDLNSCVVISVCVHIFTMMHPASFLTPLPDQRKWTIFWNALAYSASCNYPRFMHQF